MAIFTPKPTNFYLTFFEFKANSLRSIMVEPDILYFYGVVMSALSFAGNPRPIIATLGCKVACGRGTVDERATEATALLVWRSQTMVRSTVRRHKGDSVCRMSLWVALV